MDLGEGELQAISEPLDGRGGMKHNRYYPTERAQRALIRDSELCRRDVRRFSLSAIASYAQATSPGFTLQFLHAGHALVV
jgi:hypothetical protein